MNKIRVATAMVAIGIISLGLTGCGKPKIEPIPLATTKASATPQEVTKEVETGVSTIKYDATSIIDTSRSVVDTAKYPVKGFLPKADPQAKPDDTTAKTDKKQDNSESAVGTNPDAITIQKEDDNVLQFIKDTKTAQSDYTDFAVAYSSSDGYLVAMLKPKGGKEVAVQQAITEFIASQVQNAKDTSIKDMYSNHKLEKHNGYVVLIVCNKSEDVAKSILDRMIATDKLIESAIRDKYNQQSAGSQVKKDDKVTNDQNKAGNNTNTKK